MDSELKKCIEDLTEAVRLGTSYNLRSSREARDKIEQASQEIDALKVEITKTKKEFSLKVDSLTASIQDASSSSTRLGKIMIVLTIIIALSAILTAFSPFVLPSVPNQSE